MELSIIVILAALLVATGLIIYFVRSNKGNGSESILLLQQQLDAIREHMRTSLDGNTQVLAGQLSELSKQLSLQLHNHTGTMSDTRKAMDERLDNAARVISDVQKALGQMKEALVPVGEIRDILKAPKLRGGFGEIILEKLLEEMMPAKQFETQYQFKDGERVDAVVRLGADLVPIDSKFPLDKYQEYQSAESEEAKKAARKAFVSAVKKHIDDVTKYIRPSEGTYPFALMYIPSENIYYELFVSSLAGDSLWPHSSAKRIFPVSSNTLYVYLQTIALGLRGMKISEQAKEIFAHLEQLQKNVLDIRKTFEKIGTHLKNAAGAYQEADKRLEKFEGKLSSMGRKQSEEEISAPQEEVPLIQ